MLNAIFVPKRKISTFVKMTHHKIVIFIRLQVNRYEMDGPFNKMRKSYKILLDKRKEGSHLGDIGIDERIM